MREARISPQAINNPSKHSGHAQREQRRVYCLRGCGSRWQPSEVSSEARARLSLGVAFQYSTESGRVETSTNTHAKPTHSQHTLTSGENCSRVVRRAAARIRLRTVELRARPKAAPITDQQHHINNTTAVNSRAIAGKPIAEAERNNESISVDLVLKVF